MSKKKYSWTDQRNRTGKNGLDAGAGRGKGSDDELCTGEPCPRTGVEDAAAVFTEAANQEANHAGFYAALNGMYPRDFWALVRGLAKAEAAGENSLKKLAERFRAAGLDAAAPELEIFAAQEGHHGAILQKLLDKYGKNIDTTGKKVYVCGCCGYEYVGDLDDEAENYVCPVCGMPKKAFSLNA